MFTNWVLKLCSFSLSACQPKSNTTVSTVTSSTQGWREAGQKLGNYKHSKNIFISTSELFFIFEWGSTTSYSHSQMGDKWWDKFQIRSALFDLQEQRFSRIPNISHKPAAEAAARTLRSAFRIAVVDPHFKWTISGLYFLKEKAPRISWGHYHMSGNPVKQSNAAECFSCFTVGKLKGL